jgi:hypothetical protein
LDEVFSHIEADPVDFGFVGTDVHYKTSVGYNFAFGDGLAWDEKIVLDPSMRSPTTCTNHPNSFAAALFQIVNVLSSLIRWRYSRLAPVSSLITELVMGIGIFWWVVNAMGQNIRWISVWA